MPRYLLAIFYSLLPRQWWSGWRPDSTVTLERSTVLSGLFEFGFCAWLLLHNYVAFLIVRERQLTGVADANQGTQLYFAGILTLEYLFHPLTVVLAYLAAEGLVRVLAVWIGEEILPSFPAKLASLIPVLWAREMEKRRAGVLVPDTLEQLDGSDGMIRIASCRPKDGWRENITIVLNDELYELTEQQRGSTPLCFVYILRRQARGKIIRAIRRYEIH